MTNDIDIDETGKLLPADKPEKARSMPKRRGKKKAQSSPDPGSDFTQAPSTVYSGPEIRERLLEAVTEDHLKEIAKALEMEGVNPNTIRAQISKLRSKGHLIFQTAVTETETKPRPVEGIIQTAKLPTIVDGQGEIFNAGVEYGMKMIVAGVRLAQELSTMGVAQASPVIRMAKEMREAEAVSSEKLAETAAEEVMGRALAYIDERVKPSKVDIAATPNPMQGIMARIAERVVDQVFNIAGGQKGGGRGAEVSLPPGWEDNR